MRKSNHHLPPRWADRLFELYCAPHLLEDLQGDLYERFYHNVETRGIRSAKARFILDTILFIRPYVLKRKSSTETLPYFMMLSHYFKTGFRNVGRDKRYLIVNALGLALGIGCSLLLTGYIFSELSFDRAHAFAERTYRISCSTLIDTQQTQFAPIPPAFGPALKSAIPEIERTARLMTWSGDGGFCAIAYEDKLFNEDHLMVADSTVFDVMDYKLLVGNQHALEQPNRIVLSHTLAVKLFGFGYAANPKLLNTMIKVDQRELAVSGVMEDVAYATHFRPTALISWEGFGNDNVWNDSHAYTYIRLAPGSEASVIQSKLNHFVATNENVRKVAEEFGAKVSVFIEPLTGIHMNSDKSYELQPSGNRYYLYAFGIIAAFFIVMSGINYVNLSIAASAHRYKEIGVRKVMGALRGQVQKQFLTESSLMIFVSALAGLLIFYLLIPYFNEIMAYELNISLLLDPAFVLLGILLLLVLSMLSGFYPAFYLASANPVFVFRNKFQGVGRKLHFRKSLLVTQFAISSLMIVAVLTVTSQMNYISNQTLGINKENIVVVSMPWPAIKSLPTLKEELSRIKGVNGVAVTDYVPGVATLIDEHKVERSNGEMQSSTVGRLFIDKDYMNLLGLTVVDGRNFDPNSVADYKESFLVNEAAVRAYGWNEGANGPLGKKIDGFNYGKKGTVIGVVKDVNLYSLHEKVQPLIISMGIYMPYIYVKLDSKNIASTLADIEKTYEKTVQNYPFEFQFLDERFDRLYDSDRRMNRAMIGGGLILIFISGIGLFGLSAFIVVQRTKEIGVRKVMGASVREIVVLLSSEYVSLILIANMIALTSSYFLIQRWLSGYAYRVEFSWWIFVVPVLATFLLAMFSVSYQVVRASIVNPVRSLRYE